MPQINKKPILDNFGWNTESYQKAQSEFQATNSYTAPEPVQSEAPGIQEQITPTPIQPAKQEQVISEPTITPEPTVFAPEQAPQDIQTAAPVIEPTPVAPVIPRTEQLDSIARIEEAGLTLAGTETPEQIQAKASEAENVMKRREIAAEEQKAAATPIIKSENDAFMNIVRTWNADTTFDGVQIDKDLKTNAEIRFKISSKYINASTSQLYSAMKTGKLAPNTKAYNDLALANGGRETQQMLEAKQLFQTYSDTQNINEDATLNAKAFSDGEVDIVTPKRKKTTQQVSDLLIEEKGLDYAEVFRDTVIENTEISSLVKDINSKEARKDKVEMAKRKILEDVKKQYPMATISMQMAMAARMTKDLNDELSTLNIDISQDQANLNYQTNIATQLFDLEIQREQEIFDLLVEERNIIATADRARDTRITKIKENTRGLVANISNQLVSPLSMTERWTSRANQLADTGMEAENVQAVLLQEMAEERGGELTFITEAGEVKTEFRNLGDRDVLINKQTGEEIASFAKALAPEKTTGDREIIELPDGTQQLVDLRTNEVLRSFGSGGWLSSLGQFTSYGGEHDGFSGLDYGIDYKTQQPPEITLPFGGEVEKIGYDPSGFGNYVQVKMGDGKSMRFSHLQDGVFVKEGDMLSAGDAVGMMGNTGNVFGKSGKRPSEAALASGSGTHVDITLWDKGKRTSSRDVERYIKDNLQEKRKLTDKEFTQSNQIINSFASNPNVKAFESAATQSLNLLSALSEPGGAGDMAGIFTFMKTLDPSSVVRESEFELAATTSGVFDWRPIWDRLNKGSKLTPTQRKQFKDLWRQFIKNSASLYDKTYDDSVKRLEQQRIPTAGFPSRTSSLVLDAIRDPELWPSFSQSNEFQSDIVIGDISAESSPEEINALINSLSQQINQ